ncbi:GtrA family protein [Maricaulis sp.]|uniref:GtrA family protein n=1 Tax=Maricaulis sp. TaxID=1486257 RepID=UPI0034534DB4
MFKYISTGVLNTGLGAISIFSLQFIGVNYVLSNMLGYSAGLAASFIVNRAWTFRRRDAVSAFEIAKFMIVFFISYTINISVVIVFVEILKVNSYLAQMAGIVSYGAINFVGLRYVFMRVDSAEKGEGDAA